jgi:hypothetical protein
VHQSGAKLFDELTALYRNARVDAEVLPFINDMAQRYAWCDLLVCRAGALTVAEVAAAGVAAGSMAGVTAATSGRTSAGAAPIDDKRAQASALEAEILRGDVRAPSDVSPKLNETVAPASGIDSGGRSLPASQTTSRPSTEPIDRAITDRD